MSVRILAEESGQNYTEYFRRKYTYIHTSKRFCNRPYLQVRSISARKSGQNYTEYFRRKYVRSISVKKMRARLIERDRKLKVIKVRIVF